jgi:hypothetical protein
MTLRKHERKPAATPERTLTNICNQLTASSTQRGVQVLVYLAVATCDLSCEALELPRGPGPDHGWPREVSYEAGAPALAHKHRDRNS